MDKKQELWDACQKFVKDNEISCPEAISQVDRVIENSYDFLEVVCDIVGYHKCEDD